MGAHIVGSVGEINQQELESEQFEDAQPGLIVGRSGIEWQYESILQGGPGVRYVEVDATGRIVGSHRGFRRVEEEPGGDWGLHLDPICGMDSSHLPPRQCRLRGGARRRDREAGSWRSYAASQLRPRNVFAA